MEMWKKRFHVLLVLMLVLSLLSPAAVQVHAEEPTETEQTTELESTSDSNELLDEGTTESEKPAEIKESENSVQNKDGEPTDEGTSDAEQPTEEDAVKSEASEIDEAVQKVEAFINHLPELQLLTVEHAERVDEARAAFEALTDDQKQLITNEHLLVALEQQLDVLKASMLKQYKSTEQALNDIESYFSKNVPSISSALSYTELDVETEFLLGLKGAGIDIASFNWGEMNSPFDEGKFWKNGEFTKDTTPNYIYFNNGLFGAYVLELNPQKQFTLNIVKKLIDAQFSNGSNYGQFHSIDNRTIKNNVRTLLALNIGGYDAAKIVSGYTAFNEYLTLEYLLSKSFKSSTQRFGTTLADTGWALTLLGQYNLASIDEEWADENKVTAAVQSIKDDPAFVTSASVEELARFVTGLVAIGEDVNEPSWLLGENGAFISIAQYLVSKQDEHGSFGSDEDNVAALIALGDVQAGQTIYERLKELKNITKTIQLKVEGPIATLYNGPITVTDYPEVTLEKLVKAAVPSIDLTEQSGQAKWYYTREALYTKDHTNALTDFSLNVNKGENIVVYYGAHNAAKDDVLSVDDITFTKEITLTTPEGIMAGVPFEIQVTAKYSDYDSAGKLKANSYEKTHKISGAQVTFNGDVYTTNIDGIVEIPGEKAKVGEYELQVSKDIEGSYPRMLRQSKKILVQEDETPTRNIQVIVEGPTKKLHEVTVNIKENKTVYDATLKAFEENNIPYKATKATGIFTAIENVEQGTFGGWDGWNYTTNSIVYSLNNAPQQSLTGINEIIWYYGAEGDLYTGQNSLDENMTLKPFIELQNEAVVGQDLKIKITGQHRIYNTLSQIIEEQKVVSLANATVTFNGGTYKTDTQGFVTIPGEKLAEGAMKLEVSGYAENSYPKVVRTDFIFDVKDEVTVTVDVRIEGYKGTIANEKNVTVTGVNKVTAADVTEQILQKLDVPYKKSSSGIFDLINNEASSELSMASGWVYKVNEVYPNVYAPDLEVHTGDEIVWHYTNYTSIVENEYYGMYIGSGIDTVDKVTFEPIIDMPKQAKAGEPLKIKVTGKYNIVDFGFVTQQKGLTANLDQVTIEFNNKQYVTDDYGEVTIPAEDLIAGHYELKFTKDLPGIMTVYGKEKIIESYPRIIRTYKSLEVTNEEETTEPDESDSEEKDETLGNVNEKLTNEEKAYQALQRAKGYLINNNKLVSERVNESHSGFWMLSAMYAAGIDIPNFNWITKPTATGTHWTAQINSAMSGANEDAGTIIGAAILGLDATKLKGRNLIQDLAAKQKQNNTFGLLTYEPWVMIAMDLVDGVYDQQAQIDYLLSIQDKKTGYFGTIEATGWILMALSAHQDQPAVKAAINLAVTSYNRDYLQLGFTDDSNAMSTIIGGLTAVGEDVFSDKWTYEKDGKRINIIGYLVDNYVLEDGGVLYQKNLTTSSLMSLEQTYISLSNALTKSSIYKEIKTGKQIELQPSTPNEENKEESAQPSPTPTDSEVTASISIAGMLSQTTQKFQPNSTVFDALLAAASENGVTIQYRKTSLGIYVYGINGLKEFDKGAESGWMYRVNGTYPNVSADMYVLQPGDLIEWLYTTDLGEDIGSVVAESDKPKKSEEKEVMEESELIVEQKDNQISTELTKEMLQQYTSGTNNLVIKDEQGKKIEVPQSILQKIELAEDEKVSVNVEQNTEHNRIDITLEITSDGESKPLYTGKEYAKVYVPAPQATENVVVLQEVNGEYRAVPHKIVDGQIIILVKGSGSFIIKEEKITFNDITNLANKDEIEFLASRHIIKGNGNGEFAPNEDITRGEFAAMMSRALGLQVQGSSKFQDTKGKWYEQDVLALYEAGITKGKSDTTFDPDTTITREEAAAFMARILDYVNYQAESGQLNYKDASNIRAEFKEAIALLNQLDIMTGNSDGTFNAKGNTTRVQMAKILKRTLTISGLM